MLAHSMPKTAQKIPSPIEPPSGLSPASCHSSSAIPHSATSVPATKLRVIRCPSSHQPNTALETISMVNSTATIPEVRWSSAR